MPQLYVPSRYFGGPVMVPPTVKPEGTVATPEPTASSQVVAPAEAVTTAWPYMICFGSAGLGIAGVIVVLVLRRAAPKAAPEEYQSPEIELETFEEPGLVPDLDVIEAAMYVGDTTRVLTLVLMGLVQRGVLTVVNRNPLQLELTNPEMELLFL